MTFRVMVVKKDGRPIGVRAAQINGRVVYLALRDEPEPMNWYDTVKVGIPSKEEWMAKAIIKAGGEPLKKTGTGLPRRTLPMGVGCVPWYQQFERLR